MADLKQLAEQLVNLTVKEVNELAGILKDEYGIEPAAAVAVAAGPVGGASAEAEAPAEQTEFTVVLTAAGQAKLGVVIISKPSGFKTLCISFIKESVSTICSITSPA